MAAGLTKEEKLERAKTVSTNRILTQDDFQKLKARQMSKQMSADPKAKGRKRKSEVSTQELETKEVR